ncbi:MAG: hypothetical protein K940chlam9_01837, partial [Chlamydiae bacterium]|nr:hypothetical protein [Chlamydiota bacterium]
MYIFAKKNRPCSLCELLFWCLIGIEKLEICCSVLTFKAKSCVEKVDRNLFVFLYSFC